MLKIMMATTAMSGALGLGALNGGLALDPETLGLKRDYVFHVATERYGAADLLIDVEDVILGLEGSNMTIDATVVLPNLEEFANQVLDPPSRINLSDHIGYIRGDLLKAKVDGEMSNSVDLRGKFRLRNRALFGDNFTHHHNATLSVHPVTEGLSIAIDLHDKRNFSDYVEGKMQEAIDDKPISFTIPDELVEAGLKIDSVNFSGDMKADNFSINAQLTAPLLSLPSIISYFASSERE